MLTDEARELLENNPIAFATVDRGGKPNVIGVSGVKVVGDCQVVITDNFMRQTRENVMVNKSVCLAFWNPEEEGFKMVGTAEYFADGKWVEFVKALPENKGFPAKGAILVTAEKLTRLGG